MNSSSIATDSPTIFAFSSAIKKIHTQGDCCCDECKLVVIDATSNVPFTESQFNLSCNNNSNNSMLRMLSIFEGIDGIDCHGAGSFANKDMKFSLHNDNDKMESNDFYQCDLSCSLSRLNIDNDNRNLCSDRVGTSSLTSNVYSNRRWENNMNNKSDNNWNRLVSPNKGVLVQQKLTKISFSESGDGRIDRRTTSSDLYSVLDTDFKGNNNNNSLINNSISSKSYFSSIGGNNCGNDMKINSNINSSSYDKLEFHEVKKNDKGSTSVKNIAKHPSSTSSMVGTSSIVNVRKESKCKAIETNELISTANDGMPTRLIPEKLLAPLVWSTESSEKNEIILTNKTNGNHAERINSNQLRSGIESSWSDITYQSKNDNKYRFKYDDFTDDDDDSVCSISLLDDDDVCVGGYNIKDLSVVSEQKDLSEQLVTMNNCDFDVDDCTITKPPLKIVGVDKVKKVKTVSFAETIEFRDYDLVSYEHPSCTDGLALSLDWGCTEPYSLPFDIICKERTFRYLFPKRLSFTERRRRLQLVSPTSYSIWRDETMIGQQKDLQTSERNSDHQDQQPESQQPHQPLSSDMDDISCKIENTSGLASTRASLIPLTTLSFSELPSSQATPSDASASMNLGSVIAMMQQSLASSPVMPFATITFDDDDSDDD